MTITSLGLNTVKQHKNWFRSTGNDFEKRNIFRLQTGAGIIQRRNSDEKKRRHSPQLSLLLLSWHLNDPRFVNDASSPEHKMNSVKVG